jgi:hypothetical protein
MVNRIFPIDARKSNTSHCYSESAMEGSDLLPLIDATTMQCEEHAQLTRSDTPFTRGKDKRCCRELEGY